MKEILYVKGGNLLSGEVNIGGAKNSLVALIPAAIVTKSIVKLENVIPIDDTYTLINILHKLNVKTLYDDKSCLYIDARNIKNIKLDSEDVSKMRASYYFMGALLSLYNNVSVLFPGGCNFGERPIDLHLFAFSNLGVDYKEEKGVYHFKKEKVRCSEFTFSNKSVGATINAILASCKGREKIKINNCSMEPEIDDLISFLNKCGCNIVRDGDVILVNGVNELHGCDYKVMPDRIEAGTFMIIAGMLGNNVKIKNIKLVDVRNVVDILKNIGVKIVELNNCLIVSKGNNYKNIDVLVEPYPGFPTDLQQPLTVLLSLCNGKSSIKETIYPTRLSHVNSLNVMNADIHIEDDIILVNGNREFVGASVSGKDLRGGISLVLAALVAKGESKIDGVKYIKRGYSDLVYKLKSLGANVSIERINEDEEQVI